MEKNYSQWVSHNPIIWVSHFFFRHSKTSCIYFGNQDSTSVRMYNGSSLVGFCESILKIHVLFWLIIDKCVYLLSVSFLLFPSFGPSDSGISGQVRWFKSMTVTWEPSTPSPLLMRIVGLSARRTTRVFEFGSGKYRLLKTAWHTDAVLGIWLCWFIVTVSMPPSKAYNPTPQYRVVNNGRLRLCLAAAQRNQHFWTWSRENLFSMFSHATLDK